jgi:hypothetical protein
MNRLPVDSTVVAAVGYDPASRVLELEFRSGGHVYRYFEVPPEEYQSFLGAKSKGAYLDQRLKGARYRFERMS